MRDAHTFFQATAFVYFPNTTREPCPRASSLASDAAAAVLCVRKNDSPTTNCTEGSCCGHIICTNATHTHPTPKAQSSILLTRTSANPKHEIWFCVTDEYTRPTFTSFPQRVLSRSWRARFLADIQQKRRKQSKQRDPIQQQCSPEQQPPPDAKKRTEGGLAFKKQTSNRSEDRFVAPALPYADYVLLLLLVAAVAAEGTCDRSVSVLRVARWWHKLTFLHPRGMLSAPCRSTFDTSY